ncbi:MAG: hypothetical protein ACYDCC_02135 [Actinomycetota bacterium]
MRSTIATANDLQVTIDLTDSKIVERPFSSRSNNAIACDRAIGAFKVTRRQRRIRSVIEMISDAALTMGAITLITLGFKAQFGLPRGIGGIALGVALLGIGAAISLRGRSSKSGGDDPATTMHTERNVVVLDEPNVIVLDQSVHSAA